MTTYTTVFGNDAIPPSTSSYSALVLSANVVLYWPELAQSNYLATDIIDVTSDADHAITLPDASEVSVGRSLLMNNLSTYTITVKDALGATVATMLPGEIKNIYLTDNTTASGLWRVYTFGTGTSTADAASLAGYGMSVINGDLAQTSPAKITAGSVSVMTSDRAGTYIFKANGAVTCALPAAGPAGDGFFFSLANQGTGAVTLNPNSTETVDGELTKDINPGESAMLVCDGANWVTVGYGRSTQFQFTKLVLDITTGTPFTLTSTQAENKLLQFIGAPTAPVEVILPAIVAVYYVECSYSGAFFTTLKTAAGLGVTVSATDRVIIYCDGVDVVFAQTSGLPAISLAGGTAGAVVYQSTLDVTSFTTTGAVGQILLSGGVGSPTWLAQGTIGQVALSAGPDNPPVWNDLNGLVVKNTPTGDIAAVTVQAAINELDTEKVPRTSLTGSAKLPTGTTAERDGTPQPGWTRFNSTLGKTETWTGTRWVTGGGATGSGVDDIFYENGTTVNSDYTITAGKNAMSAGPITIAAGVTVTIPAGTTWSIV